MNVYFVTIGVLRQKHMSCAELANLKLLERKHPHTFLAP